MIKRSGMTLLGTLPDGAEITAMTAYADRVIATTNKGAYVFGADGFRKLEPSKMAIMQYQMPLSWMK